MKDIILGKHYPSWQEGQARTITFIVTEDCQLRCRYCYLVGKNDKRRMTFSTARTAIDYFLRERDIFNDSSVIFDFIGGEPFIEIELIDQISDYLKLRMYEQDHPWFNSYRFSFSTNGIMYNDPRVQQYIKKNEAHISIGITIDGMKAKHDLHRIYPDGSGSYEDVVRNIPLWLKQFPEASTKVTVGSEDLPLIKDSVAHLWDLGIKHVNINVVFEDVWKPEDDRVFEEQLKDLADYILDNKLYEGYTCSFFAENIGKPLDPELENQNWCGAGRMIAVDGDGNFYPCVRFTQFSLANKKAIHVGSCYEGLNLNKLRPFQALDRISQSPAECVSCEVASGCAWCQGVNYDAADTATIYQRSVYACKMHKARVRANNYYWAKYYEKVR